MIAGPCANDEILHIVTLSVLLLVVIGLAWAMTAWVRMMRAMRTAVHDWEYARTQYESAVEAHHTEDPYS